MSSRLAPIVIFSLLGLIIGIPFLLRPPAAERQALPAEQTLIVITPHVQQISKEFGPAFEAWHEKKYGQPVRVDWRGPMGTSDIYKLLTAQYTAAISDGRIGHDGSCQAGVMTFDILFGGGSYEHNRLKSGVTVKVGTDDQGKPKMVTIPMSQPAGFEQGQLDAWFGENKIGTQYLYDPQQFWVGTALSAFGIVYNKDIYKKMGLHEPSQFADLCLPELSGWVALADPRQSGSLATTLDAILNNELWAIAREEGWEKELDAAIVAEPRGKRASWVKTLWPTRGPSIQRAWDRGWRMLREMCANTRYFTGSSTKPPIDVSQGEAAVGLAIDFYGRGQSQAVLLPGQDPATSRVGYTDPRGATYIDADPISILRGGPNPELARRFIEFTLTTHGQALWEFPPVDVAAAKSSPADDMMGPESHALRRMPIRREMYEVHRASFVDKDLAPYETASQTKPANWRDAIGVMMGAFAIDVGDEQRDAWRALNRARKHAGFPKDALAEMEQLFYAWPEHVLPGADAKKLAFTPDNLAEIFASWKTTEDAGYAARCRIRYTEFFNANYDRIEELASRHGA
jgi:iron(III) transport system substrate-binding protein